MEKPTSRRRQVGSETQNNEQEWRCETQQEAYLPETSNDPIGQRGPKPIEPDEDSSAGRQNNLVLATADRLHGLVSDGARRHPTCLTRRLLGVAVDHLVKELTGSCTGANQQHVDSIFNEFSSKRVAKPMKPRICSHNTHFSWGRRGGPTQNLC